MSSDCACCLWTVEERRARQELKSPGKRCCSVWLERAEVDFRTERRQAPEGPQVRCRSSLSSRRETGLGALVVSAGMLDVGFTKESSKFTSHLKTKQLVFFIWLWKHVSQIIRPKCGSPSQPRKRRPLGLPEIRVSISSLFSKSLGIWASTMWWLINNIHFS